MINSERTRLRLTVRGDDPKTAYKYRVEALRAGFAVAIQPGDRVREGEVERRVVAVREPLAGPDLAWGREAEGPEVALSEAARIVAPHRPAILLGIDELHARWAEDREEPEAPRTRETLGELARRGVKEGVDAGLDVLERLEGPLSEALRGPLKEALRCQPPGVVEVALRKRKAAPRVALPALAAVAPDEDMARDVLDRLGELDAEVFQEVVRRCGRWLVGLGGPGFARAEVREQVASMAREHAEQAARDALFVYGARPLFPEDVLEEALGDATPRVRASAAAELARRGRAERVWDYAQEERSREALAALIDDPALRVLALPRAVAQRLVEWPEDGPETQALRVQALLRLGESPSAEAAEVARPWLGGSDVEAWAAATFAVGVCGLSSLGDAALEAAAGTDDLGLRGLTLEALARLEHGRAREALAAWGGALASAGLWGEEVVDGVGVLVGESVDVTELGTRFVIDPPKGVGRRARALEVVRVLDARDRAVDARVLRERVGPSKLERYKG